jgi:hypothetical protein
VPLIFYIPQDKLPPTYTISPSVNSVNEGSSVTYTITTTNFGSGTLYYTNSGSSTTADFVDGTSSGSISITNNSGTLTKELVNDLSTEGSESIIIQLRTGSTSGSIVATASTVTINDTSLTPTYAIVPSVTSVNEGSSVTYTITTTNFGSGTLYYTNSGMSTSVDFTDSTNSGSISITNDAGTLTKTLVTDLLTEGSESIIIQLRTGSVSGPIVASASAVTINDTSLTVVSRDVTTSYASLLLSGDGTSGLGNSSFIDSSNNNLAVTPSGSVSQGSFSPYGDGWSYYFNGSSYTYTSDSTVLNLTGDFTIEFWAFISSSSATGWLINRGGGTGIGYPSYGIAYTTGSLNFSASSANISEDISAFGSASSKIGTPTLDAWNHIVVTRQGNNYTGYLNGTLGFTITSALTPYASTGRGLQIGGNAKTTWGGATPDTALVCYISNLRITKGAALYTANFTPASSPLTTTVTSGSVSVLTCKSNRFIENASALTLTSIGTTTVSKYSPFSITSYDKTIIGRSASFAAASWLELAHNAAFNFGTGDFTIESWINPSSLTNSPMLFHKLNGNTATSGWFIGLGTAGQLYIGHGSQPVSFVTFSANIQINTWTHIAVTRVGTTITVFINGVKLTPQTISTAALSYDNTVVAQIGSWRVFTTTRDYTGSISNFKITKGSAVYTADFIPATLLTSDASTSLLLDCNSGILKDISSNALALTKTGTITVVNKGPSVVSSLGGSNYLSGTASNLLAASNTALHLSGDFTIEMWYYPVAAGGMLVCKGGGSGIAYASYEIYYNLAGNLNFCASSANTGYDIGAETSTTVGVIGYPKLNAWNHIVVSRQGNNYRGFLNGVLGFTITTALTPFDSSPRGLAIGSNYTTTWGVTPTYCASGYMGDFRIVKGNALYTASFTPPTAPLTNVSGTSLLLSGTNAGIYDSTGLNDVVTVGDTMTSATRYKFGSGSIYFDGTGDYLTIPNSEQLTIGANDYTIECWVNLSSVSASSLYIFDQRAALATGIYLTLLYNSSSFKLVVNGSTVLSSTTAPVINTWYHIAIARVGNITKMFVNGIQEGGQYASRSTYILGRTTIGGDSYSYSTSMAGYIEDFRITNGKARYTSNFIPPYNSLVNNPSTPSYAATLLLNGDDLIDKSIYANSLTNSGVTNNATYAKYGSGSLSIGTANRLTVPASIYTNICNDSFTIEAWIYPTASGMNMIVTQDDGNSNGTCFQVRLNSLVPEFLYFTNSARTSAASIVGTAIAINTWTHVAVSWDKSTLRLFTNGSLTITKAASTMYSSIVSTAIGNYTGAVNSGFNGYLDDIRITKGKAIYIYDFVPPTAALTTDVTDSITLVDKTELLMHCEDLLDSSIKNNKTFILLNTAPTISSGGAIAASANCISFNGTQQLLFNGYSSLNAVSDFTFECYALVSTATAINRQFFSIGSSLGFGFSAGGLRIINESTGATRTSGGTGVTTNTWYHVAFVRSNGTIFGYLNGVQVISYGYSTVLNNANYWRVGGNNWGSFIGKMDEIRFVTRPIYLTAFTPPTTLLTNV